jgi:hypothetical protein
MNKIIVATTIAILAAVPAVAHAQDPDPATGCYTGDYQGAPIDVCPTPEPDPTNCYTGDYQGAPIEICMPTGWTPDPSWTYQGAPIVMHVSKDYVPPVVEPAAPPAATVPAAPAEPVAADLGWVADYVALLG